MPHFHLRLFGPQLSRNCLPNTLVRPLYGYLVEYTHFQPNKLQSNYHAHVLKNAPSSFAAAGFFPRLHLSGALQIRVDAGEISDSGKCFQKNISINLYENRTWNEGFPIDGFYDSTGKLSDEDQKERQRRRKIGLANKGKVPWNKGRKHSAETCERIKQRTIEALKNPKVKKKMSKHSRGHSDWSKARIGFSLRRVWGKRLRGKQLREKFYLFWEECIAKAAKEGGIEENELEWDSYEKIKQEIALQHLQRAAEKEKARVMMAKIRAERAARAKAVKMASLDQKRKEREEKAKARKEREERATAEKMVRLAEKKKLQEMKAKARKEIKRKSSRKLKEDKEELGVSQGIKLTQRFTRIHREKCKNGEVAARWDTQIFHIPDWEKMNLEFVRLEKLRKEVSLADQIRAAKDKRSVTVDREALAVSSFGSSSNESLGE